MSQRFVTVLLLSTLLAGCDGNPCGTVGSGTTPGTGGGTSTSTIPGSLSVNVKAVAYDGTNLAMQIEGLDSTPTVVPFNSALLRRPESDFAR